MNCPYICLMFSIISQLAIAEQVAVTFSLRKGDRLSLSPTLRRRGLC